ncbi:hypothetical protein V2J09_017612, partial [Rumex salicifolius]
FWLLYQLDLYFFWFIWQQFQSQELVLYPARSLGAAIIYNNSKVWSDHWIFWVGPLIGAALAAAYMQIIIRAFPFKSSASAQE